MRHRVHTVLGDAENYDNRIGGTARADRRADLTASLAQHGLAVHAWYGVRVFSDTLPSDTPVPDDSELQALLACEERAAATDPYRSIAALTHLVAIRG